MSAIESLITSLCQQARELGASLAVAVPTTDILVDERAELKCFVPLCPHYGKDLLCPPNVMPAARFREVLGRYHGAVLIEVAIPPGELRRGKAKASKTEYMHTLKDSQRKLLEIVGRVEATGIERGYPFAAGLVAGACPLCEECVGTSSGLPCRHPFKARPSMEAMGIDVMATAKKAGLDLNFGNSNSRSWIGLVLVD